MSDKKKRSAKTTRQQYCLFIEEVQTNKAFRNNKYNPEKLDVLETTWEQLTNNLNSTGGPQHSTKHRKSIFSDWKSSVRKKAREIQVARLETGRGICGKALTDLEQLLLDITGEVVTKGGGFSELGVVPVPANIENEQTGVIAQNDMLPAGETLPEREHNLTDTPRLSKSHRFNTIISNKASSTLTSRPTLTSSVKELINKTDAKQPILTSINDNLTLLVALKQKEVQLLEMKLRLEHPDVEVEFSETE